MPIGNIACVYRITAVARGSSPVQGQEKQLAAPEQASEGGGASLADAVSAVRRPESQSSPPHHYTAAGIHAS